MRVAVPVLVEVRIARADVQSLAEGLQGGGAAYRHEVTVTKAMAVRMRAPDGGFFIETASPETQWIEQAALLSTDDYASWRWHVTPRERGRKRLQLIISARTVSGDGLAAETALPDQVITVRVRTNYAKMAVAFDRLERRGGARRADRQVRRGRLGHRRAARRQADEKLGPFREDGGDGGAQLANARALFGRGRDHMRICRRMRLQCLGRCLLQRA